MYLKQLLLVSFAMALSACSSPQLQDYSDNQPVLNPEEFFDGALTAHGVVKNRSGKVIRYFTATIDASWKNGQGTLDERFEFNDGEIQHRVWTLVPKEGGNKYAEQTYKATAGDVIGPGRAQVSGNAMRLDYTLEIDFRDRKLQLAVEDWMWLVDENTIINQSILRKWGFRVGTIQLTIVRDQN